MGPGHKGDGWEGGVVGECAVGCAGGANYEQVRAYSDDPHDVAPISSLAGVAGLTTSASTSLLASPASMSLSSADGAGGSWMLHAPES